MLNENRANSARFFCNPIFADSLFYGLPPEIRYSLARLKQRKQIKKGILFIAAGAESPGIYILRAGKARLFSNPELGKLLIARPVKINEFLGLTETIAGLPYKINVASISPCLCEFIEREDFLSFLRGESQFCFRLAQFLGARFIKNYQLLCSSRL